MKLLNPKNQIVTFLLELSFLYLGIFGILINPVFADKKPSESQCLKLFEKIINTTSTENSLSEQERLLIQKCRQYTTSEVNVPLPNVTECLNFMALTAKAMLQEDMTQIDKISAKQLNSLTRCPEVIQTFYIPSSAMEPTLTHNDRILVNKTIYNSQTPQRADLVVFQPTETLQQQNFQVPSVKGSLLI